jgi:hypothetical protein
MVSAALLPLVVVLMLEILGADHQCATGVGVITAAGLLVVWDFLRRICMGYVVGDWRCSPS